MKTQPTTDEDILRWIPLKMASGWNRSNANDFTAPFASDADFISFDGTHLHGRDNIRAFHQEIFQTLVKGSHLETELKFIKFIDPRVAVIHSRAWLTLAGEERISRGRESMQMIVVTKTEGRWEVQVLQNSRIVPLNQQPFWGDFNSIPVEAQQKVAEVTSSLKPAPGAERSL